MSAQPKENTAPDLVGIEIDGTSMQVPKGSMIIQAADDAGIPIPRFCYHRKLAIAANCRMCLVDVEMGGKPMGKPAPACATPVADGMVVRTKSDKALHAQRNVMEFLLINHPLDCPICDQGGECELQDISLGYGRSVSRFTERKRTIADEDIGPLVATEMTRCIQCTRCVRFMGEIAGTNELGGMSRGENLQIGTYIGKSIESELSGNIIDVCPVGALTNKPFQFQARAWELLARKSIGYHDALGSNLWLHTRRDKILRTVPRDAESINECWLSDRDRYSYQGLDADDRATTPMVKRNGQWQNVSWEDALSFAMESLQQVRGDELGMLVHPATSSEEGELLVRMAEALECRHVDHRLRQLDFADMAAAVPFGMPVDQFDKLDAALLIGSDLRSEMPLLHQRLRQASKGERLDVDAAKRNRFDLSTRTGAQIFVLNPARFDFNYKLAAETVVAPQALVDEALMLAAAAIELAGAGSVTDGGSNAALREALATVQVTDAARATVQALQEASSAVILLGEAALLHPHASWLRAAARFVAEATGVAYAEIPPGANAVGLSRIGVLPRQEGLDARGMLQSPRKAYVVYGAEPPFDFADGALTMSALHAAERVIAFSPFASASLKAVADVILPLTLLPEMNATLVNVYGAAQQTSAGAKAPGDALEGWKVLRALGGEMQLNGFDFDSLEQLRDTLRSHTPTKGRGLCERTAADEGLVRLATLPIYRVDAVLRRAAALNAHPLNRGAAARVHPAEAARLSLQDGCSVHVADDAVLPLVLDAAVPEGAVWIEAAYADTATLPPYGAAVTLSKA